MPSPFPGMNPYLEQEDTWHDFHQRFCPAAAEVISLQVRPNYYVKLEEHVYIHELSMDDRVLVGRPDIGIASPVSVVSIKSGGTLEAPVYGNLGPTVDIVRESFLEIRDREDRQLVTVLELLSPANKKPGPDREQYVAKRRQYLHSSVNFIEIDLLRRWPRLPLEGLPDCDYYAMVSRVEERPRIGIWPVRLKDRLPAIPIPLRDPHPDARLDIQELVHRIYDAAGYMDYIYSGRPSPPLHPADAEWAEGILGGVR